MNWRAVVLLALHAIGFAAAAGSARAELKPGQLDELHTRLVALADAIDSGKAEQTQQAAAALSRWARQTDTSLPVDGLCRQAQQLAAQDFDSEDDAPRELHAVLRQLAGEISRARTQADSPAAQPVDPSDAQRILGELLASGEYTNIEDIGWWPRLFLKLQQWARKLLEKLMGLTIVQKFGQVAFYITLAVLLLPLIALVAYLFWRQLQSGRKLPAELEAHAVVALESPEVYAARAEELLRQGQYLDALKQFHLFVLSTLEQRGLVVHDRTRTNWEYLAQLQRSLAAPQPVSLLRALNVIYDRAVYGGQPCDDALVREFSTTTSRLLLAVASPVPPAAVAAPQPTTG